MAGDIVGQRLLLDRCCSFVLAWFLVEGIKPIECLLDRRFFFHLYWYRLAENFIVDFRNHMGMGYWKSCVVMGDLVFPFDETRSQVQL